MILYLDMFGSYQVSRVSDVVSVGQVLNCMCIGLDVRGNINLSLKAITHTPGSQSNPGVKESAANVQRTPEVWKPVSNVHKKQKSKDDPRRSGNESSSPIVIRSAAECDKEEKSAALNENSKG